MLPGPSSRSTNFDSELILQSIFLVIPFVLEQQAWFRVCVVPVVPMTFGFNISVDLMSSPISYIFSKPLDKCVVIIINILRSSKISIEFLMRNSILCPWWFGLSLTTLLHSLQHKTCSCFVLYLEFLAIQLMLCSTAEYYHLLWQECHEDYSTS